MDIVKVEGVIDPAISAYVRDTVDEAEGSGAAVLLQIDSPGSYGDEAWKLGAYLRKAKVPVVSWVGPAGARAQGGALFLLYSSSLVAMAPGTGIGPARPFDLGVSAAKEARSDITRNSNDLDALAAASGTLPEAMGRLLKGEMLAARPALRSGAVRLLAADIPALLRTLDGRSARTAEGPVALATLSRPGERVGVRFHDLGPFRRILHAISTPTAVYVLLLLGLWSIAFELTQPGVGVAGIGGALSLALAAYGLTVIPVNWAGVVLLLAGTGLMALDIVVRRVGALTIAGAAGFAAGSILAWRGVAPAIDLAPWLIVLATVAGALYFGFALTVALKARERVRTAQVGLVGLTGEARGDIDPEGAVFVKGTLWRARSSNGSIPKGRRVRVRGIDGLILRVEEDPDG